MFVWKDEVGRRPRCPHATHGAEKGCEGLGFSLDWWWRWELHIAISDQRVKVSAATIESPVHFKLRFSGRSERRRSGFRSKVLSPMAERGSAAPGIRLVFLSRLQSTTTNLSSPPPSPSQVISTAVPSLFSDLSPLYDHPGKEQSEMPPKNIIEIGGKEVLF